MARILLVGALALFSCSASASSPGGDAAVAEVASTDAPAVDASDVVASDIASDVASDVPGAQPFTTPVGRWSWVDVEGSVCGDGSPTGVGVNRVESPRGVLVVLGGGGACWDEQTCFVLNTAARGPFGAAQLDAMATGLRGSLLDRDRAQNPFAQWSLVFVPNCTGDMFLGDRAASFGDGGAARTWHFRGRPAVDRAFARVAATVGPSAPVAVLGLSVGGVGAVFLHAQIRARLPRNPLYVLSDSGFVLDTGPAAATLRARWHEAWGLDWLDARCPACRMSPTAIFALNAASFPTDRTGLFGSRQDQVLRSFHQAGAGEYEAALQAAVMSFTTSPTRRAFVVEGSAHTFSASTAAVTAADGTQLLPWINQMVTDDPAWSTHAF